MIVNLEVIDFMACKEFAERQIETSYDLYKDRGEFRYYKQLEDITTGKLGEIAAYKYLKHKGLQTEYPCFKVLSENEKSYDADLQTHDTNYHVKTQPEQSVKKYGYSWLVQSKDPLVHSPKDNDMLILVAQEDVLRYNVLGEYKASEIPWADPRYYKHTKRAIYYGDLK